MPAFVANGPDIPEHLLQAHEEGRVVFFCGAGISNPAGLPSFQGLVDQIYTELGTTLTKIERQAYDKKQYDAALDQLERRYPGQRIAVRTALAKVLKPNWRKKDALTTHHALLELASDRKGKVRLVTTNFDRIFHWVDAKHKLGIQGFAAPLLPIPKPSRWNGVVYLHGLLPETTDETELNRLVLTSGDFGLAYLNERWAARFVSELFRNYTVCFVGYGINDPVLRYMMDALAADEMRGETRPEAYAFASFNEGGKKQARIEWEAKGVTPLLYEVPTGTQNHSALHRTLKEWADTYRDGVRGKEMIITQHASTPPLGPSRADFAVGRVLWALTDGLAAEHFANLIPVPPLKWLEPLSENQFVHRDLSRFGVAANSDENNKLSFSIVRRPTPYTHSPRMCIVDMGGRGSNWDDVMIQLARWLTRHLGDPELIIWLAKQGGQLHEQFVLRVRDQLELLDRLVAEGNQVELDRILAGAPKAIPSPFMRTLWHLLLAGRLKSNAHNSDLYDWLRRIKKDGVTPSLRMELREILTPCITLRAPFQWGETEADATEPKRIKDIVNWELVLSGKHVHSTLLDRADKPKWDAELPNLLQDFTLLLRDALALSQELGGANEQCDLSYMQQPSISDHPQNRNFHDWTSLIELARDAWLATAKIDHARACHAAEGWWQVPYPVFKRLALFAAAQNDVISQRQALDWLLADESWWLWSVETQREALRLLVALAKKLSDSEIAELVQAILAGPPRDMSAVDIDQERWVRIVDREICLRLFKIQAAGVVLDKAAKNKLDEFTRVYPNFRLTEDERDEFPFWMGRVEGGEFGVPLGFELAPRTRPELDEWLIKYPSSERTFHQDGWRECCREDFSIAISALSAITNMDQMKDRWREAMQVGSEDALLKQSWPVIAKILVGASEEIIQSLAQSISWWVQAQAKTFDGHQDLFFELIQRLLNIDYQVDDVADDDPVFSAINHPVGQVSQALLDWWYRAGLVDDQGLSNVLKPIFTDLCDTQIKKYRYARVLLSAHVIALYRVDREWTTAHILPLFDWNRSSFEARLAWESFLWSPRIHQPLLSVLKTSLLETAARYGELGKHAEQYAAFLIFAALDPSETFKPNELADAVGHLPAEGLSSASQALVRALEGVRDQRGEYWRNRVLPLVRYIWPKSRDLLTPAISDNLARLCIAAGEMFPDALKELHHWLVPVQYPDYLIQLLDESKLSSQFPKDALWILNAVVGDDVQWLPKELKLCLDAIKQTDQKLADDVRFIRLADLYRRRGRE